MLQERSWAWVVVVCLFCGASLRAQQSGSGGDSSAGAAVDSTPASAVAATPGAVPRLIKFSAVINPKANPQIAQITQTKENENGKSQSPTVVDVTFSLYQLQEGGSALWSESQQVQLDSQGRYSVLLGATLPEGLPLDLFTSGEALWLGVEAQAPGATEQPRVLLVAVPYALKAVDADTLGGKPASAYLSVDDSSATPQGAGLAVAASAAAGSGSGNKGEAEKKQRSANPSGSGTANYVPLWLDNNGTLGNSAFYQASNGNVGLGTTSPAQVLQVNGTTEILSTGTGAGFKFRMRDGTTDSVWYGMGNVSRFFRTDVGDIMSVTSNGNGTANVGIGTMAPAQVLHVNGANEIMSTGTGAGFKFRMRDGTTDSVWYGMGKVSRFWRSDVGDIMGVTSNGNGTANVGIGTMAPAQVLHVNGANEILSTGTGAGFKFRMRDSTTDSVWYGRGNVSRFWRSDAGDIIGITSAGSVGIGTMSPAATLEVNGPAQFDASVTATSFSGNGSGLTGINAATLGGLGASAFAQLGASSNTFSGSVAASSFSGNGSSLTNVNALLLDGLSASSFATLGANTFVGTQTITSGNLALTSGDLALPDTTGSSVGVLTFGGVSFLHDCCSGSGSGDTFLGAGAGNFTMTGYANTATGYQALQANTLGYYNTASGYQALQANTTGYYNTASGDQALYSNNTGAVNTASGVSALYSNTTGNNNTASGYQALVANTSGYYNTAVGFQAGYYPTGNLPTTGSTSTFVGAGATATVDGLTNATAIGYNAQVGKSNALVLGSSVFVGICTTTPRNIFTIGQGCTDAIADGWDTYSSRRWKSDIQPLRGALAKVELLRGVSYTYTANGKHDIGMIAEEVGKVVPEVVTYEDNGKDARGIDYARLTALLVEAVKQQQTEVQQQQRQIRQQRAEIRTLQARVRRLEASNSSPAQPLAKAARTAEPKAGK